MFYPKTNQTENSREMTSAFLGYNHNPVISDGEFYDMWNMSSDNYPLLSPRKRRTIQLQLKNTKWDVRETTFKNTYHGNIHEAYVVSTSEALDMDGIQHIRISFDLNTVFACPADVEIELYNEAGEIINVLTDSTTEPRYSRDFRTTIDTVTIVIKLYAHAVDPVTFRPQVPYITNILIEQENDLVRGILCKNGKLAYMIGQYLYYDGARYDLIGLLPADDDRVSKVQMLSFGAYILIFPMGIYLNTLNTEDLGLMGAFQSMAGTATYTLCDSLGDAYTATASDTAPENPDDGEYWLDTGSEAPGLYTWSNALAMWSGVSTTYIKIEFPQDLNGEFAEGDAVFLNTDLEDINNGSVIRAIGDNYIVVTGIMWEVLEEQTFTPEDPMTIERKIPDLDYVCVSQNRVWGCYYGQGEDGILNELHASKLGDFKNWYVFDGTAADSYTLSMGDDGDFTGAVTYRGYPMFFKENNLYRIYGSYPAAYQLSSYDCRGVQKGSERSIAIVGEYLVYKSLADVCVFDGSSPVSISQALGKIKYHDAVGGSGINKYYLSVLDENDKAALFAYDFKEGVWHKEDDLRITEFAYNQSGKLYGQSGQTIYGFGDAVEDFDLTGEKEGEVFWFVVTGLLGINSPDHKTPGRITIRADIPNDAEIKVSISYDERSWSQVSILTGKGKVTSYSVVPDPLRSDNYRLKLEGHKGSKVYSITRTYDDGSEEE